MVRRVFEYSTQIPGYGGKYWISESGKVCRAGRPGYLSPCKLKRGGYLAVNLSKDGKPKTWPVHKLVALAFLCPAPSPNHHVAHNDGNVENPHRRNLRWATRKENEADKIRHGRSNRGARNGQSRLTDGDVLAIKEALATGETGSSIAKRYGVTQSCISGINIGRIWKYV